MDTPFSFQPTNSIGSWTYERLLARVLLGPNGCWIFDGADDRTGYARIEVAGKSVAAHRLMYELATGPIPERLCVCHACDVRKCINPAHLFLGSHTDNMRDMIAKGRYVNPNALKTHCKNGHPLAGENLRVSRFGRRSCKTCTILRRRHEVTARGGRPSKKRRHPLPIEAFV